MDLDLVLNAEVLVTIAGNAVFVALILLLLIKPVLNNLVSEKWYGLAMNGAALVIGILGAVLAQLVFSVDYASIFNAVLVGIGGAAVAVYGYEVGKHVGRLRDG